MYIYTYIFCWKRDIIWNHGKVTTFPQTYSLKSNARPMAGLKSNKPFFYGKIDTKYKCSHLLYKNSRVVAFQRIK